MAVPLQHRKNSACEACDATDVDTTLRHGNIWMCESCWAKEPKLDQIIEQSRTIDASIEIKQDLFNAATIPAIELKAAIEQDETIPVEQKAYRYTDECMNRFLHLKQVIFAEEQALNEKKNALRMWQVQVQTSAASLRSEQREKFRQLDINYTPTSPKSPKPAAPKVPGVKSPKQIEIRAAAEKYGVPENVLTMFAKVRPNLALEEAARQIAEGMTKVASATKS